jgi:hypothetical protein
MLKQEIIDDKRINKNLFEYVKDHVEHFGFFPCDYEDFKTGEVIVYPEYMDLFNNKQIKKLTSIFNKFNG